MFKSWFGKHIGELTAAALALILAAGAACTPTSAPMTDAKKQLGEYISRSFTVKSAAERKELMQYLAGDARQRLAAWSDEQFQQAFVDGKRKFVKFSVTEVKSISDREKSLTYELIFLDPGRGHEARVTAKKLAQMIFENDRWLIANVHNIKELVEFKDELSLP